MADRDFYDIKGLGELPPDNEPFHPAPPYEPPRPYKGRPMKRKTTGRSHIWWVLGAVLVVLIIAAVAMLLTNSRKNSKQVATASTTIAPRPAAVTNNGTATYISNGTDLNLSFTYPASWSTTPPSGDNKTDQTITVSSPMSSLPTADGSTVTGKVVVTVRPGSAPINELNSNNPTAAATSTQIAYTAPTTSQYQYPYITFINFANGSKTAGAFEEVMITGNTQFAKGQLVQAAALSGLDPIISATFTKCLTSACTGSDAVPVGITNTLWQNDAIYQSVLSIFQSFKLN